MRRAASVQSMSPSSLVRRGAYVASGVVLRFLVRRARRHRVGHVHEEAARRCRRGRPRALRWFRRARSAERVVASMAPASSLAATRMMVTPVSVSPAMTARCTGRGAAVFRQERRVHVDHAEPRHGEEPGRNQLPVRRDHPEVGTPGGRAPPPHPVPAATRAARVAAIAPPPRPSPARRSPSGRGRGGDRAASPRRRRRAATRSAPRASAPRSAACRRRRRGVRYHFPARSSFRILRTMKSFWRPRNRSTNSLPSR